MHRHAVFGYDDTVAGSIAVGDVEQHAREAPWRHRPIHVGPCPIRDHGHQDSQIRGVASGRHMFEPSEDSAGFRARHHRERRNRRHRVPHVTTRAHVGGVPVDRERIGGSLDERALLVRPRRKAFSDDLTHDLRIIAGSKNGFGKPAECKLEVPRARSEIIGRRGYHPARV